MGTNYFLHRDVCECCGRAAQTLHIGKSSYGWCFGLHVAKNEWEREEGLPSSLAEWQKLWSEPKSIIKDEYERVVGADEMFKQITGRKGRGGPPCRDAIQGPNGLLRSRLIEHHCIGHGEGTYDLIIGDFS